MSNIRVENRFIKLLTFFLIRLQIQLIKEISNIICLEFHRVFDLALLKKTGIMQNQQCFIKGTGRQIAGIVLYHPMGYFYTNRLLPG